MSNRRTKPIAIGAGIAAAAALPAYYLLFRPWQVRWGATDEEVQRPMPGDGVVEGAWDISTRAITIQATPEDIWPWLAQMGYQRGGMYSYDWIDQLIGVLDRPSSWQILPEFQRLEPGDEIPMGHGPGWPVAAVEPLRSLVLDIREPGIHITWSIGLYPLDARHTRLVLRIRIRTPLRMRLISLFPPADFGQFLMTRRMLLGIKERAEVTSAQREQGQDHQGSE